MAAVLAVAFPAVVARRFARLSQPATVAVFPRIDLFPLAGFVVPPAAEGGRPSSSTTAATAATDVTGIGVFVELDVVVVFVVAGPSICLTCDKRTTRAGRDLSRKFFCNHLGGNHQLNVVSAQMMARHLYARVLSTLGPPLDPASAVFVLPRRGPATYATV